MDFKVNMYTTIKQFKRAGVFEDFMKFGQLSKYERFTGILNGDDVRGWICLADNNIYQLERIGHEKTESGKINS